jgi:hypothetical protein
MAGTGPLVLALEHEHVRVSGGGAVEGGLAALVVLVAAEGDGLAV